MSCVCLEEAIAILNLWYAHHVVISHPKDDMVLIRYIGI